MDLAERQNPAPLAPTGGPTGPRGVTGGRVAGWRRQWGALGGTTVTGAVLFFAAWEAVVDLFQVPRYILPAPSAVFRQFILHFPLIWKYTLVTGGETLVGFVIAVTIGVP